MHSISQDPAVIKAEEKLDGELGNALYRQLQAKWIEQGYNARLMGLDRSDDVTLWSNEHRYGWDLADAMIDAQFDEDKPGLDAMPLPMWEDMIAKAYAEVL